MIEVTVPQKNETPTGDIDALFDLIQGASELGFIRRSLLEDYLKSNSTRPVLFLAKFDGVVAGGSVIASRRPYAHIMKTGEVAVPKEYRRKRIATTLYFAMACTGLIEGRREVQEDVIESLSPWMVRSTCEGEGFLLSLNYHHYGTLPKRTGAFRDIEYWCKPYIEFEDWEQRVPPDSRVYLPEMDQARLYFEQNMLNYDRHDPDLRVTIEKYRDMFVYGDHEMVSVAVK
jgi:hypothetical protein